MTPLFVAIVVGLVAAVLLAKGPANITGHDSTDQGIAWLLLIVAVGCLGWAAVKIFQSLK